MSSKEKTIKDDIILQILEAHRKGNIKFLEEVYSSKVDIYQVNSDKWNWLHYATQQEDCPLEIYKYYIDKGVDVNAQDDWGNTPLYYAVTRVKKYDVIKIMLENGANPDIKNEDEESAFDKTFLDIKLTKLMLEYKADPILRDTKGLNRMDYYYDCLDFARKFNNKEEEEFYLAQIELLKKYLPKGYKYKRVYSQIGVDNKKQKEQNKKLEKHKSYINAIKREYQLNENETDLYDDYIYVWIEVANMTTKRIYEKTQEIVEDDQSLKDVNLDKLKNLINIEFDKKLQREKIWVHETDNDRLTLAFRELDEELNIISCDDAGYTADEGWDYIQEIDEDEEGNIGYFYTTEIEIFNCLVYNEMDFQFGDIKGNSSKGIEIGKTIIKILDKYGIKTKWNESISDTITIVDFTWQKRFDLN